MDDIEQSLVLPVGSLPLSRYARYYTHKENRVIGFYTLTVIDDERYDLPLGQRRWIEDAQNLPGQYDGGCSAVNVTYDTARRTIEQVSCNGSIAGAAAEHPLPPVMSLTMLAG